MRWKLVRGGVEISKGGVEISKDRVEISKDRSLLGGGPYGMASLTLQWAQ